MGQAFYASVSGIKAAQTQINVVADNIANVNTVGFKESSVNFSDIYYNTISSGSSATDSLGGRNAKQIGIGTSVASISRNFNSGSTNATGLNTDMNIQGDGFFTVLDQNNNVLYTRAGNFTLDEQGNLVMPSGYKVLGTDVSFSTTNSTTPIKIPILINSVTSANTVDIASKDIADFNAKPISSGDFTLTTNVSGTETDHTITINDGDTLTDIVGYLNTALGANGTASISNGGISITTDANTSLSFAAGSSNFLKQTGITASSTPGQTYNSNILDYKSSITASENADTALKYTEFEVGDDGAIAVKYSNGDQLSVQFNASDQLEFVYTTAAGVTITGSDVTVSGDVATPANLMMQISNFVNENGLVAKGSNVYDEGPNCGDVFYGTPGSNLFGSVQTGALEASNVDLTKQFSDMIIAQRAIEANSRVFSTQNQVLQTLVYIGQ